MRGAGRIACPKWIAVLRMRSQHKLQTVKVARGITKIARQIDAAEPFRAGRNADAIVSNRRSERMRAVAANIHG